MPSRLLVLLGWLLFVACAPQAGKHPEPEPITLRITSSHWSDVNVYAVRGGMRERIASQVNMTRPVTVRVPRWAVEDGRLRLQAEVIGSSASILTDAVAVRPRMQFQVGYVLGNSFLYPL